MTVKPPIAAVAKDPHWSAKMQALRNRRPLERTLRIWIDDDKRVEVLTALDDVAVLENKLDEVADATESADLTKQRDEAKAKADVLEESIGDAAITCTLHSIPGADFDALIAQYPPDEDDKKAGKTYNADTFGPALVAMCDADGMTEADAVELWKLLSRSERDMLFSTAVMVCTATRIDLVASRQ